MTTENGPLAHLIGVNAWLPGMAGLRELLGIRLFCSHCSESALVCYHISFAFSGHHHLAMMRSMNHVADVWCEDAPCLKVLSRQTWSIKLSVHVRMRISFLVEKKRHKLCG